MSLPDYIKIWLTSVKPFLPVFLPKSDPPPGVDLIIGDVRWLIVVEWLEIEQCSQWRAYRKPLSLFWIVPSPIPYNLPFLQNGSSKCMPRTNFAMCAATWKIWWKILSKQLCNVPDVIMSWAMLPVDKLQITNGICSYSNALLFSKLQFETRSSAVWNCPRAVRWSVRGCTELPWQVHWHFY